jgi:hypothetical protein
MSKVYAVMIRWVHSEPQPARVDGALSPLGDWFRYNPETWFVTTDRELSAVDSAVRKVLGFNDSILVIGVDPYEFGGVGPPQVWSWLKARQDPTLSALLRSGNAMRP